MRLHELARLTDTSEASIKYYLREGLLPPGRVVNARLAEYDEAHVARLRLICGLRTIVGVTIADLASLVHRIDDPAVSLHEVLGDAQRLGLGLTADVGATDDDRGDDGGADPADDGAADGGDDVAGDEEPAVVTELIERLGWGSQAVVVRRALATQVAQMIDLGIPVTVETLERYAQAADTVARGDIGFVTTVDSRDEAALRTAVGAHSFGRLWLGLLAVAQASHAAEDSAARA